MAVTEGSVITNVAALTAYSIQTKEQSETTPTATGTDSSILYNSQSRNQGNFTVFYSLATADVTEDLHRTGKTGSDSWKEKAIALLVASYQAQKDPDWAANSVSFEGYTVNRGGYAGKSQINTGYRTAYEALLEALTSVDSAPFSDQDEDGIVQSKDAEDYPASWRISGIDTDYSDPF